MKDYSCCRPRDTAMLFIHPFRLGQCRMQHNSRYSVAAQVKMLARSIHCTKCDPVAFLLALAARLRKICGYSETIEGCYDTLMNLAS